MLVSGISCIIILHEEYLPQMSRYKIFEMQKISQTTLIRCQKRSMVSQIGHMISGNKDGETLFSPTLISCELETLH